MEKFLSIILSLLILIPKYFILEIQLIVLKMNKVKKIPFKFHHQKKYNKNLNNKILRIW